MAAVQASEAKEWVGVIGDLVKIYEDFAVTPAEREAARIEQERLRTQQATAGAQALATQALGRVAAWVAVGVLGTWVLVKAIK